MRASNKYTMETFRAEMRRRIAATGDSISNVQAPSRKRRAPVRGLKRESWRTFVDRLIASCRERLAELEQRDPSELMPCPWGQVFGGECLDPCRCQGKREVTVGFMRAHYERVLAEYGGTAR